MQERHVAGALGDAEEFLHVAREVGIEPFTVKIRVQFIRGGATKSRELP